MVLRLKIPAVLLVGVLGLFAASPAFGWHIHEDCDRPLHLGPPDGHCAPGEADSKLPLDHITHDAEPGRFGVSLVALPARLPRLVTPVPGLPFAPLVEPPLERIVMVPRAGCSHVPRAPPI